MKPQQHRQCATNAVRPWRNGNLQTTAALENEMMIMNGNLSKFQMRGKEKISMNFDKAHVIIASENIKDSNRE